jgi:tetratricopeptide (TPR) repeat protein
MSYFFCRRAVALVTMLLALAFVLPAAYSKSAVDSAIDAVRESLNSGHGSDAADLAHQLFKKSDKRSHRFLAEELGQEFLMKGDFENAKVFYEIALTEPSLDLYCGSTKYGYEKVSDIARKKGLEKLANDASNRATEIKLFETRFRAGNVSDAEAKAWLRPLFESENLRSQSAGNFYLAKLRLTQKRNEEAVELAQKAIVAERKVFAATAPSQESARRLIMECSMLADIILKGKDKQKAVTVLQEGLDLAKKYPVEEQGASPSNPHHFRIAIAEAQGRSCDDVFKSRFDSALDELVIDGPYSSVLLNRLRDQYVECIKEEAAFFVTHNRPDLAVKIYEREIPNMLAKMPTPDPFRGAVFANYHAMVLKAQLDDPSNKSVPACNICQSNSNVVPDFPGGCVIYRMYHWRCGSCKRVF